MPALRRVSDVTVSDAAAQDLIEIYVYTQRTFGDAQAERYTRDLYSRFQLLADFPGIGLPALIGTTACFCFPTGSHVIYYRRHDTGILIGRILHGAMNADDHAFDGDD